MNTGLEQIRQTMADYLCQQGVPAVTAWPAAPRQEWTEPVVVVSVRGCRAGSASFQDYLGERYDERSGRWEERYGLDLQEFSCGQTAWDGESRRLKRPVEAVCTAWLCAVTDAGGVFVDFELRGVRKE